MQTVLDDNIMYDYMIFHYCGQTKQSVQPQNVSFFFSDLPRQLIKGLRRSRTRKHASALFRQKYKEGIFSSERISKNISEKVPKFCKEEKHNIGWSILIRLLTPVIHCIGLLTSCPRQLLLLPKFL